MTIENDILTDEERAACDAVDLTQLLGTPAERLKFAHGKAMQFWREKRVAESSAKMAWSQSAQHSEIAKGAMDLLRKSLNDNLSLELHDEIKDFLGQWTATN